MPTEASADDPATLALTAIALTALGLATFAVLPGRATARHHARDRPGAPRLKHTPRRSGLAAATA